MNRDELISHLQPGSLERKIFVRPKTRKLIFQETAQLLKVMDQVSCDIQLAAAAGADQEQRKAEQIFRFLQSRYYSLISRL